MGTSKNSSLKVWEPTLQVLNKNPVRITLNGRRHYTTPLAQGAAPSVTTILSQTASEANKQKLEMWSKNNPGVKEAAAERGTAIHYGMECYCKKIAHEVPEEYSDFWTGMPGILDQFEEFIWAESPLLEKHQFTVGSDDVARVWGCDDEGRAWAGAPDIIGVVGGKLTLADLKTSVKPYSRKWPDKDLEKGTPEWRDLLGGHLKFKKCILQMCAYDIAITQTLGMTVQQAAILVSTPIRTQVFKISRNYLNVMHEKWYKLVAEYYAQVEEVGVYDPNLI